MFTDEELEALILGLRLTAAHGDAALGRAAAEVVAKLRAVLPKDLRVSGLLAGPARERPRDLVELSEVRRARRRQRKAEVDSVERHGAGSTRTIWPLALGYFERVRVVVAWCLPRAREALLREWRERDRSPRSSRSLPRRGLTGRHSPEPGEAER